jgi:hypothetical protein
MNRHLAPLLLLSTLFLHACGGGSSPPSISVSFTTAPPSSIGLSATAPIAVTVSNDSANAGVTFSCAPSGSCGTFTSVTTTTATYNSPAAVPSGGSVTITAKSVTDTTKFANASVTITGPAITVTFTSTFPAVLQTSATLPVTVSLKNDTGNAGVSWSCAPGSCGTFTNTTPTSATYNAPSSVPIGGRVTITATSVAQTSANATSGSIAITGSASLASLKGQYAFLVTSPTGSRGTAAWVGSVNLDGAGNLAAVGTTLFAGVEDVVAPTRNDQGDNIYPTATKPASKYTVDVSGHGQITMATVRGEFLTISFVITSGNSSGVATHAEIIEADDSRGEAGDPGSGTLDLQDATAFSTSSLARTYSFTMSGVQNDLAATYPPESLGGILDLSSPTAISGAVDVVSGGTVASSAAGPGSQIDTGPDPNGRGTLHVVLPGASTTRSLTYYVVNSKVMRVFENSNVSFTGGSMYSQGSTPPTMLSGPYVYQHSGWSTAGRTVAAGVFSVAGGTISTGGISDANSGGKNPITPAPAVAVSGSWSSPLSPVILLALTDAAGSNSFNTYPVDPTLNILDPNNATGHGGALLLHLDTNINGTGILLPQATPTTFSLNYALNLVNAIAASTPNEIDLVGILTSAGNANFSVNLADYTEASVTPNPMINAPLSGTFTADTSASHPGRYTATFTVGVPPAAITPYPYIPGATAPVTFAVSIYQATPSQAFVVETDTQAITLGQMVQQNLP